jgi:hypothetical protein
MDVFHVGSVASWLMRAPGRFALGILLLACGGCPPKPAPKRAPPSAQASGGQAAAPRTFDIDKALAQELEQQPSHPVAAPDGSFKANLEASSPPEVSAGQGFTKIVAPLDHAKLACFVYPQVKDVAELIRLIAADTLDKAAPDHEWADVHGYQVAGWG